MMKMIDLLPNEQESYSILNYVTQNRRKSLWLHAIYLYLTLYGNELRLCVVQSFRPALTTNAMCRSSSRNYFQ